MILNNMKAQDKILQEPFFSKLLDSQDIGIFVTDRSCNVLLMNDVMSKRLGAGDSIRSCKDGIARTFPSLCDNCPVKKNVMSLQPVSYEVQDGQGDYYSVRYSTIEWVDNTPSTSISLRDISEERAMLERLNSLAYIDQLTGIPNRRRFMEDFEALAEQIVKHEVAGILAIFDLDHFKSVNDSYGHGTGDTMLKRLADYLVYEKAFKGSLYRLGGDEFVMFFAEPAGKLLSQEACRSHFKGILSEALRVYTLPNIEISCTISMGVSFFPWQGKDYSELLRKADIALYKAKENGRNQICWFEDADDTAKLLKDMFIGILPVLTDDEYTHGYELVDEAINGDGTDMSDISVNLNEFDRTIEALGIDDLENDAWYFISYSNQLHNHSVARNLPKDKFVIRIRLSGKPSKGDYKKYRELSSLGYLIAFSGINQGNASPQIFQMAHYCFFDPLETDLAFQRKSIAHNPAIQFIAVGIDTQLEYNAAKKQGYTLFQGDYFKQPKVVKKTKEIDPLKVNYLRLLKLTANDDYTNFPEVSAIISADVALSYKLLRLLNSPVNGRRNRISSITMAVTYLGEVNLKKWIAILAVRGLSDRTPMELIRLSLIRAQFGENLCRYIKPKLDSKHVFLAGLLSLLDVVLQKGMEDVCDEIMVADEIRNSLLTEEGLYSELVRFFAHYENADWTEASAFAEMYQLSDRQITTSYIEAVKWYNELVNDV